MRAVVQRVSEARINTESGHSDTIGQGLLVLLGIEENDGQEDIDWLCAKIVRLRIFNDEKGIMNVSLKDTGGEIMIVSQFTLHASTKKGNRPSYIRSASPETAIPLYNSFIAKMEQETGKTVKTGVFGDHMSIRLVNEGPVTIVIDTKNKE